MRYGCYNSRSPALLASGVVARPGACPLVAPSRLADALFASHLAAVGRAVALPAVAAGADDHQAAAARTVEHPVALVDDRAPATEDWTPGPPPAILSLIVVVIALAVTQKPRPLRQRPGLRFVGGGPVLPHGLVAGHAIITRVGHVACGASVTPAMGEAAVRSLPARCRGSEIRDNNHIHGRRLERTKSTACARAEPHPLCPLRGWGEPDPGGKHLGKNQIHSLAGRGRREPDPRGLRREERTTSSDYARREPEPNYSPNRRKAAGPNRRGQRATIRFVRAFLRS